MNWRERLADWISGGALTRARWDAGFDLAREAANIAAQRDEAILRATQAEEARRAVEADLARAKRTAKVTDENWRQLAAELARIRSDRQKGEAL